MNAPFSNRLDVLGSLNLDLVAHVRRAPGPGETVADGTLTRHPGGKGLNQAIAAARLGADVRMVGAVGRDSHGTQLRQSLVDAGIDVSGLQAVNETTGTALIVVDAHGENSIVVCPGANSRIDPELIAHDPRVPTLAQLEILPEIVSRVARRTTALFALNASPVRPLDPALWDHIDLFIVNEVEYSQSPRLATARLVAVTLGAKGAILLRRGVKIASAVSPAVAVASTVGAGDAFAAALTVGLLRGMDEKIALQAACAVGAATAADACTQPLLRPLDDYLPTVRDANG